MCPTILGKSAVGMAFWGVLLCLLAGCRRADDGRETVVVYSACDRQFAEPILQDFERSTGIRVLAKYDVESQKTVGLSNAIMAESARPRCDLFWNNEILHTLRLGQRGLLAKHRAAEAQRYPDAFRDPDGRWYGFAARARILLCNREQVSQDDCPRSILDLVDPRWQGDVALAKPLFGTTATHVAVLTAMWGEARTREFLRSVRHNVQIVAGNRQVATAVARGEVAWGITDTDDAMVEIDAGSPVFVVYPDQGAEQMGTLLIPNTVALIQQERVSPAARKLLDFLLTSSVESRLAQGSSAQVPLHRQANVPSRLKIPPDIRWMPVDFAAVAEAWPSTVTVLRELFAAGANSAPP